MTEQDRKYVIKALEYALHKCINVDGDAETHYNTLTNALEVVKNCSIQSVSESAVRDLLSNILKVAASMITTGISSEISEWDLPKTTPKKAKRKIVEEADKWNDTNRTRAIELKSVYDVLSKHFR